MNRFLKAFFAGLLLAFVGLSFFYSPLGQRLEEEYGLALLFKLRGPRKTPDKAVIINIDNDSSEKLGFSTQFSKWPRSVHAALVDRLVKYGAKVIAFDIFFAENKKQEDDQVLADAIGRAGNVVLIEELLHASLDSAGQEAVPGGIEIESLAQPIPPLAVTALALAPFPLPKIPVRVNQVWLFKSSSGDIPTLPAAVFQAARLNQYNKLHDLLVEKVPRIAKNFPATADQAIATLGLVETMRKIREVFLKNPRLRHDLIVEINGTGSSAVSATTRKNILALIDMYGSENSTVIDFYGPPASITTLSYHDLLSSPEDPAGSIAQEIRDRAIFIGAARTTWSNQKDGFYTVFSQADGVDLSGVEVAATVYSNLAERRSVHPLPAWGSILLILSCSVVAFVLSYLLTPPIAGASLLAGGSLILIASYYAFSFAGTWLPLVTPVILTPCIAFVWANLSNHLAAHTERRNISKALQLYLPEQAVKELTKDLAFVSKGNKKVYSTCLITDAQDYTALSESIPPEELSRLMKEYYRYLFREIKDAGGVICNVIGDSMLAQWPSTVPEPLHNQKACTAAFQISRAVAQFNEINGDRRLPTRIGLHSGYLLMDNIGAEDHFEYAPVGDIVNTVSRIEGLNKHLATQILASEKALQGVSGINSRDVGSFLLSGKANPVNIFELPAIQEPGQDWIRLKDAFAEALALFRAGKWERAQNGFARCLILHKEDGPSLFYKNLCASYINHPPSSDWQGVVQVGK
jgi:adenylate cyclase